MANAGQGYQAILWGEGGGSLEIDFCLPPEGQEVVNLGLLLLVVGIISFFFH